MGDAQDAGGVVRVGAGEEFLRVGDAARPYTCRRLSRTPPLSGIAGMGAAAVTLRVRLVAEYAGLNCLPLPIARPLIVANWPVREPKVITWKLFPMAGLKPFTRARLSIPSSVAAPDVVIRPNLTDRRAANVDAHRLDRSQC
ncbi:MAG: hypothetical protein ABIZ56_06905 [Chthoniobacteraceae bacterium]